MLQHIKVFFSRLYSQLAKVNDSPQRIALGFGVGVFLGIFPGTGPVAALAAAYLFRINKATALLGSVLTNTWLSVVTFLAAIKTGAFVLGVRWQDIYDQSKGLFSHFQWNIFFNVSVLNIVLPVMIGYTVIGFLCGVVGYTVVFFILSRRKASG